MKINRDDLTHKAVSAALEVIDEAFNKQTKKSVGPCGDKLAGELHQVIEKALSELCSWDENNNVELRSYTK